MTDDEQMDDLYDDEYCAEELDCTYCGGDGGDPANDGVLPCPYCDGEGYKWWV